MKRRWSEGVYREIFSEIINLIWCRQNGSVAWRNAGREELIARQRKHEKY